MIEFPRMLSTMGSLLVDHWQLSRPCAFCQRQLTTAMPSVTERQSASASPPRSLPLSPTHLRHERELPSRREWCDACEARIARNQHACPRCAEPVASLALSQQACARCLSSPPAFARCFAPLRYEGLLAGLFQRYKDQHQRRAGRLLRQLMQRELAHFCREWRQAHPHGAVLLVPADAYRRRQRGHDALAELCRGLSPAIAGYPRDRARVRDRRMPQEASVAEARAAPDQRLRDRRGRLKAQRGRYDIEGLLPEHVLLIDDVMTSGATLDSLAQACLRAGAREVDACVLARTPLALRGAQ